MFRRLSLAVAAILISGCSAGPTPTAPPTPTPIIIYVTPSPAPDTPAPTEGQQFQTYHYVLLVDQDQNASGDRPGADIDGIELNKNGSTLFLSQIHESDFGGVQPSGDNSNFDNALGSPEDECQEKDPIYWDRINFVSLGGDGGYLIGSFTGLAALEPGDTLTVHACAGPLSETWTLSVGVSTDINDPNWLEIISAGVAVEDVTVPNLPQVPQN